MEAKRLERQRFVQGGHRLLQQEQEEDRSLRDQRQDGTLEPLECHRRAGSQGGKGAYVHVPRTSSKIE